MKQSIVFLLGILFIALTFGALRNSREGLGDPFAFIKKPIAQIKALICYLGELFKWMGHATKCVQNFFVNFFLGCVVAYGVQLMIAVALSPLWISCYIGEFMYSKSHKKYSPHIYKWGSENIKLFPYINKMCYRCGYAPPKRKKDGTYENDKLEFPVYPKI